MHRQLLFKLDQNPDGRGLRCDRHGLFPGRDALLQRVQRGCFHARPLGELRKVLARADGDEESSESRVRSVQRVASAPNRGDMARAMITAVLMRLPDPDDALAKAGFDPDEPRDESGRWANGGTGGRSGDAGNAFESRASAEMLGTEATFRPGLYPNRSQVADTGAGNARDQADEAPKLILAAAEGEDDPRFGIGGNNPPEELIP